MTLRIWKMPTLDDCLGQEYCCCWTQKALNSFPKHQFNFCVRSCTEERYHELNPTGNKIIRWFLPIVCQSCYWWVVGGGRYPVELVEVCTSWPRHHNLFSLKNRYNELYKREKFYHTSYGVRQISQVGNYTYKKEIWAWCKWMGVKKDRMLWFKGTAIVKIC